MDRPSPQREQSSQPAQRDMMYCHECMDEWYRDEHGLTCPECGSDFTEVIENDNDPRDFAHDDHEGDDDEDDDPTHPGHHGHHHHHGAHPHRNIWADDDPEEGDISNVHFTRVGPSQFNVQATFTRSISPGRLGGGGLGPGSIGSFMSMLNGLAGQARAQQRQHQEQQQQNQNPGEGGQENADGQQNNTQGDQPGVRTSRFTYHGGIRLQPRDANNPEPRIEPVDDITNVLAGLIAAIGSPAGGHGHMHHHHHHEHRDGGQNQPDIPPIFQFFTSLGLLPNGQFGDAVYSQEALDRIVSQLMEQTATSNAPGPASQDDIDTLPRRQVDEAMLGAEGRAECSICMDEVNIGETVTELPCKHWFHHQCVAAWLGEHDTCPHCRKGITKKNETEPGNSSGEQAPPGPGASRTMPGAFVSGDGSATNPFAVPDDLGVTNPHSTSQTTDNQDNSTPNSGRGAGERFRRDMFGP